MLVLTRKMDEAIRIGDDIVVKVVSIDKNSVRLGIEAPGDVVLLREELFQAVSEENVRAATSEEADLPLESLKERIAAS